MNFTPQIKKKSIQKDPSPMKQELGKDMKAFLAQMKVYQNINREREWSIEEYSEWMANRWSFDSKEAAENVLRNCSLELDEDRIETAWEVWYVRWLETVGAQTKRDAFKFITEVDEESGIEFFKKDIDLEYLIKEAYIDRVFPVYSEADMKFMGHVSFEALRAWVFHDNNILIRNKKDCSELDENDWIWSQIHNTILNPGEISEITDDKVYLYSKPQK